MKPTQAICVDCRISPATVSATAIHSFDDKGKANGSQEAVCFDCAKLREAPVE